jgi:ribonuclease P protein component
VGPVRLRRVATSPGPPRVAYAVGRGVGGAVRRNAVRRRLRAAVRAHAGLLEPGTAYLFSAGPAAGAMSGRELATSVEALLAEHTS